MGLWSSIRVRVAPPIPDEISDDFAQLRATRLQEKAWLPYFVLLITVPTMIYGAAPGAHPAIRFGIPLVIATACLFGFLAQLGAPKTQQCVRASRRLVRRSMIESSIVAALCSSWSVFSWFGASPGNQLYYPMILTIGSLATAYCLSMMRLAALLNMAICICPVLFLLFVSGTRMDLVFAISLLICCGFMIHMIISQHDQLASMLLMQQKMQRLAETDPLTGLANRRVLTDRIEALMAPGTDNAPPFALVLLDLDGFKPVNDRLGHAAGDELLIAVGARLTEAAGPEAIVARIGGDEFAVLVPGADNAATQMLTTKLLSPLVTPIMIDGEPVRIGASCGTACWPVDGTSREELMRQADLALYSGKSEARVAVAQPARTTR